MVFLLLGFLLTGINFTSPAILLPIAIAILVAMFARAVSVYASIYLLKFQKKEKPIPLAWQHLLSWGSLRGALAITMVLLIPDDLALDYWNYPLSIKEFVMALVIGSIYFTLFVKGLTIGKFIKKLNLAKVGSYEKMEYLEGKSVLYNALKDILKDEYKKGEIKKDEYDRKLKVFDAKCLAAKEKIEKYSHRHKKFLKKSLTKYALGIEREVLDDLYSAKEITEKGYKKFLNKLENQERMLSERSVEIKSFDHIINNNIIDNILNFLHSFFGGKDKVFSNRDKYFYYKALIETSRAVVEELKKISVKDGVIDRGEEILELINKYNGFKNGAVQKLNELIEQNKDLKDSDKVFLANKIISMEKKVLGDILNKNLVTEKVKKLLEKEMEEELRKEFK